MIGSFLQRNFLMNTSAILLFFVLFFNTFKPSSSVETFFDSLVRQAKIPNIFSLQMCGAGLPVSGSGTNGGSLVGICQSEREDVSLLISLPLFYDYPTSSKFSV